MDGGYLGGERYLGGGQVGCQDIEEACSLGGGSSLAEGYAVSGAAAFDDDGTGVAPDAVVVAGQGAPAEGADDGEPGLLGVAGGQQVTGGFARQTAFP